MAKKKVVQINSVAAYGSTGNIANTIALLAQQQGWHPFFAYGRKEAKTNIPLLKIGNRWEQARHLVATRFMDSHGLHSKSGTKRLIAALTKIHPDIIHLHNLHGYYLNYQLLFQYIKQHKIPVIWTLHDCWPFTGHCTHFEYVGCEKWKSQCHSCELKADYPKSLVTDRSSENFKDKKAAFSGVENLTLVPVSQWLGKILKQSFLQDYPIEVIGNGLDLEQFKQTDTLPRPSILPQGKTIYLGVASVWSETKGLGDFIKASELLKADERIVLVGLNKKQLVGLPNNIIGIERTENKEALMALYKHADVYLNFTYADTYPTTNIESLACGTPVIAYQTGGCTEMVSSEVGRIIKVGDFSTALDVGRDIVKNPLPVATLKKYVAGHFDANIQLNKYIDLYHRMTNSYVKS